MINLDDRNSVNGKVLTGTSENAGDLIECEFFDEFELDLILFYRYKMMNKAGRNSVNGIVLTGISENASKLIAWEFSYGFLLIFTSVYIY